MLGQSQIDTSIGAHRRGLFRVWHGPPVIRNWRRKRVQNFEAAHINLTCDLLMDRRAV
jgi:hypothetical protein